MEYARDIFNLFCYGTLRNLFPLNFNQTHSSNHGIDTVNDRTVGIRQRKCFDHHQNEEIDKK